jgi:methionine sulfoxide reductase heme-binding subunit
MSNKYLKLVKVIAHVLCLLPFVRLLISFFTNDLTANPVEFITHSTGTWALAILLISLTITPLRKIKKLNWLILLRRMIGLYSFFYACLHFTTYIVFDLNFDFSGVTKDIAKRPFITIGFAAFVMLIPLAITSNKFSIRKLTGVSGGDIGSRTFLLASKIGCAAAGDLCGDFDFVVWRSMDWQVFRSPTATHNIA